MQDDNQRNKPPISKTEIETRKLSATAGGGLVGFAFFGPIGAIIGAVVTSIGANAWFDQEKNGGEK